MRDRPAQIWAGRGGVCGAYDFALGSLPCCISLWADHTGLYTPDKVIGTYPAVTEYGDVAAGPAAASVRVDVTCTTRVHHHNPMEPHAVIPKDVHSWWGW